ILWLHGKRTFWLCTKVLCGEDFSRKGAAELCTKSPGAGISLCNLCVLCVSVVCFCSEFINHQRHRGHRGCTEKSAIETFSAKPLYPSSTARCLTGRNTPLELTT